MDSGVGMVMVALAFTAGVVVYLLPALVAWGRGVTSATGIVLVNVFLGWTVLGWLGALIWACTAESAAQAQLRELATAHLRSQMPAPEPQTPETSAALAAGRNLGAAVGRIAAVAARRPDSN